MVLQFDYSVEQRDEVPLVSVKGELDVYTSPKLHEGLSEVVSSEPQKVVFDLLDVTYIDSTGLGTIAQTARSLSQSDGAVAVVLQSDQIRKIFDVSGLTRRNVTLYADIEAALQE